MPTDCDCCFWCTACRMTHCHDEDSHDCTTGRLVVIAGTNTTWRKS